MNSPNRNEWARMARYDPQLFRSIMQGTMDAYGFPNIRPFARR